ncbi:STAS domain-containing protein [Occultella gossypii]|uniref:STAS domain-containing protein n=1 Tax=Occultella gossypii TaxID=2800820 RepID=A0ABS7S6K3_9MICO|nr:STAS domain-containing protein [Occultella gossypii]MBZ2194813.1 STAS domain-containing protein [Occultella gossypii]
MSLHVSEVATRLVFRGEVDIAMNNRLTCVVEQVLERGGQLEVHTREVTYMDSAVMAALALLATRLPGRVRMIDPPALVRFLLEATQLNELVDIVDTPPPTGTDTHGQDDRLGHDGGGSRAGHTMAEVLRARSTGCRCSACAACQADDRN